MASIATGKIPGDVRAICQRLRDQKKRAWIVGGCVRDLLSGRTPMDWDIATDAKPEEVKRIFAKVIDTGIAHGTVTVILNRVHFEVTTLRGEGAYTDGRRPDSVEFVDDIDKDLARRDFTFNAIALDPLDDHVIDPFGGRADLEAGVLRAVGDPLERFREDGLRVLRAARFSATLGVTIDAATERAMGDPQALDTFRRVSQERVKAEWMKSMTAPRPSVAFEAMRRTGLLGVSCPELMESVGCEQNRHHAFDVWNHAMACLDACPPEPILRVGALLHDVGKPRSRAMGEKTQDWTFYNHEAIGAEMADPILTRLKFSNEERKTITDLVRHHLICYSAEWTDATVRRWLRRVSPELAPLLYQLGRADALGKGRPAEADLAAIVELEARATKLVEAGAALSTRDLALNGGDVMRSLAVPPGPIVGRMLTRLLEIVTDAPEKNTREILMDELARLAADEKG